MYKLMSKNVLLKSCKLYVCSKSYTFKNLRAECACVCVYIFTAIFNTVGIFERIRH